MCLLILHTNLQPSRQSADSSRNTEILRQYELSALAGHNLLHDGTRYFFRLKDRVPEIWVLGEWLNEWRADPKRMDNASKMLAGISSNSEKEKIYVVLTFGALYLALSSDAKPSLKATRAAFVQA